MGYEFATYMCYGILLRFIIRGVFSTFFTDSYVQTRLRHMKKAPSHKP